VDTARSISRFSKGWALVAGLAVLSWHGAARGENLQLGDSASQGGAPIHKQAVRGIVRAVNQAMISTELQARISRITFHEGEKFNRGDVLVEFDCKKQRAELGSAEAQKLEMDLTLDNFKALKKVQAAGQHDLEISEVRVTKAAAEADVLRARVDECIVTAPFAGRVLELSLHEHETPPPGRAFLGIVADDSLEIDLIVPSKWVQWLTAGSLLQFYVDEISSVRSAKVTRISPAVDPISQTVKIVAVFDRDTAGVLPGMSGTAEFMRQGESRHE
jgi:membrane fusion protein, multidrug efflux system